MRTIDLFSGCGGMSLGFQNAGFEILAAFDNWELANQVYGANFSHDVSCLDLSDVAKVTARLKQYSPEVIIGGPPCQDFSIAGKRIEKERANLTVAFAQIVTKILPRIVVMENVYNIEKSKSLSTAKKILKESGYGISSKILDASLTGVPQKRRRYFLIAALNEADELFSSTLDANLSESAMTVYDYFGDALGTEYYYAHPRNYLRRGVFSVHEPSTTIRRVNRPIPKNYVSHPADKAAISSAVRPLTTEERSRIQTFPESFMLLGSKSQKEHLIANAVPVKLAEYVANGIALTLESRGWI